MDCVSRVKKSAVPLFLHVLVHFYVFILILFVVVVLILKFHLLLLLLSASSFHSRETYLSQIRILEIEGHLPQSDSHVTKTSIPLARSCSLFFFGRCEELLSIEHYGSPP